MITKIANLVFDVVRSHRARKRRYPACNYRQCPYFISYQEMAQAHLKHLENERRQAQIDRDLDDVE